MKQRHKRIEDAKVPILPVDCNTVITRRTPVAHALKMPLLTELKNVFCLFYKDVTPTAFPMGPSFTHFAFFAANLNPVESAVLIDFVASQSSAVRRGIFVETGMINLQLRQERHIPRIILHLE
ncbi:MAG TPA: hypothetical protein VG754_11790 [Verrucomicrobiae bacterium]|jgi:hypothetical protein|nr:hypothetical protein [Verrucomicrobiae bacterium]